MANSASSMQTTIQPWGNSQGLRIPKAVLQSVGLEVNDRVELIPAEDGLMIRRVIPLKRHRTLKERLEDFYGLPIEQIHRVNPEPEVNWGPPAGAEI